MWVHERLESKRNEGVRPRTYPHNVTIALMKPLQVSMLISVEADAGKPELRQLACYRTGISCERVERAQPVQNDRQREGGEVCKYERCYRLVEVKICVVSRDMIGEVTCNRRWENEQGGMDAKRVRLDSLKDLVYNLRRRHSQGTANRDNTKHTKPEVTASQGMENPP